MRKSFAVGSLGLLMVGGSLLVRPAFGEAIAVVDPSFTTNDIGPFDNGVGVSLAFDSAWVVGGTPGLVGRFLNQADGAAAPTSKHVDEDGTAAVPLTEKYLGYMAAGNLPTPDFTIPVTTATEVAQTLTSTFEPGKTYSLTAGFAKSSLQAATTGSFIKLSFYYLDGSNVRQPLPNSSVQAFAENLVNDKTIDYTTPLISVGAGDAFAGRPIGVVITTDGNNLQTAGGEFDFDNVSVTAVPEPATMSVAAGALGLLALRRRRSTHQNG